MKVMRTSAHKIATVLVATNIAVVAVLAVSATDGSHIAEAVHAEAATESAINEPEPLDASNQAQPESEQAISGRTQDESSKSSGDSEDIGQKDGQDLAEAEGSVEPEGGQSAGSSNELNDGESESSCDATDWYGGITFYPGDRDILALLAYHEGRGVGTDAYCVTQVVLNRCNSNEFPNTVAEVIEAPGQFCSISELSNQYIESWDNLMLCYDAVDAVLDGHVYVIPQTYVWHNSNGNVYGSDGYYISEAGNCFS